MTKLIIQIPCLNEGEQLPHVFAALPRSIPGIDVIEYLVIDDGSNDNTSEVVAALGAHHVIRHRRNRGLAAAFQSGLNLALREGADIIVNTDADGQYEGSDIAKLIAPVLSGEADIVVGDRGVSDNKHFSLTKRLLQRLGSAVVRSLSGSDVTDSVSGFRAISRSAAQCITITSEFSYTTDMLIQAGRKRLEILSVPIRTHRTERPSRLFTSIPQFMVQQLSTMARAYATYNPLRTFALIGLVMVIVGAAPIARFLWFWSVGDGEGHIQSLVLGGALMTIGVLSGLMGILAELIGVNRKLQESAVQQLYQIEDRLTVIEKRAENTPSLNQIIE